MPDQRTDPRVGIARGDHSQSDQYHQWFEGLFQIISVTKLNQAAIEQLDTEVDVIIIDCRSGDSEWSEHRNEIDVSCLQSPTILITNHPPTPTAETETKIDSWLQAPVDASTLIETVEQLYIDELYFDVLDTYIKLAKRRAELVDNQSRDALRTTPEYEILMKKLEQADTVAKAQRDQLPDQFEHRVFNHIDNQK